MGGRSGGGWKDGRVGVVVGGREEGWEIRVVVSEWKEWVEGRRDGEWVEVWSE